MGVEDIALPFSGRPSRALAALDRPVFLDSLRGDSNVGPPFAPGSAGIAIRRPIARV